MGDLKPCIICNNENFELWAKLDFFEAKKCKNCEMISVNPHPTQEGLKKYYQGYLNERLDDSYEILNEQRKKMYLIDRDWILRFIVIL